MAEDMRLWEGQGLPDERDGWDDWDVQLLAGAEATNESTLESVRGRSDGLMTQYAKPGGTSSDLASTTVSMVRGRLLRGTWLALEMLDTVAVLLVYIFEWQIKNLTHCVCR